MRALRLSQICLHFPQCPICGSPMAISLIEPDSYTGAEKHIFQCSRAHSVLTTVKSN